MTTARRADVDPVTSQVRWGMGDAAVGWLMAQSAAALALVLILQPAFGYTPDQVNDDKTSLAFVALTFPALWLGFIGVPVWAAATKGAGWIADFRVRFRALDLPVGGAAGAAAQFVLVPLVSLPILWATNTDIEKLGEPARELADKATTTGGIALFFLMVAVGAPIAEELFFRGLVLRSIEKRFGTRWAIAGSSVAFGATHFQPLQFPALTAVGVVFALLAVKSGRLGPAIFAHMAFNAATVISLLWFT